MTSLFDSLPDGAAPVTLMSDLIERVGRGVAPLQFSAVDAKAEEPGGTVPATPEDEAAFSVSERARQVIAMVNAAREETANAVREQCAREFAEALASERARVEAMWAELTRDRKSYFVDLERRVAELALAIARKVLAREAKVDAMHLTAIVRAALERVQDESVSKLRVPVSTAADWRALFASGEAQVEVIADDRLPGGTVRLETSVGQVELGVAAQLEEIERGFGPLLEGV